MCKHIIITILSYHLLFYSPEKPITTSLSSSSSQTSIIIPSLIPMKTKLEGHWPDYMRNSAFIMLSPLSYPDYSTLWNNLWRESLKQGRKRPILGSVIRIIQSWDCCFYCKRALQPRKAWAPWCTPMNN